MVPARSAGPVQPRVLGATSRTITQNSSFLYNGTRTMYEREGFTYDRPKGLGNCVMVREVAPSTRA